MIGGGFALAGLVVLLSFSAFALSDMCGNKVLWAQWSPDKTHQAAVFVRDCGATTGYSFHVALIGRGNDVLETGNVTIFDGAEPGVDPRPMVKWLANDKLQVTTRQSVRFFKREQNVSRVTINYLAN
jgi:hypothetical protein